MAGQGHGTKAVVAALLANAGIAVAKFVGFALTSSGAMLAEAIHSVADAGNQLLLLLGGRRAQREATPEHSFGYGRERYFWAFVVALVLFSLGGAFAIFEGIEKIRHPHELESPGIALAILGVAIILESLSFRTATKEARPLKHDESWWQFIRRSKNPELPVVLLEDFGALIGLALAFSAVLIAHATGDATWDGYGTLCIGVLLTMIAIVLAIEMKSLLIGESADRPTEDLICEAIESQPMVRRLIHLRTQHLAPEELLVAAKCELIDVRSADDVAAAINATEAAIRAAVPEATLIYLEPDMYRPEHAGPSV